MSDYDMRDARFAGLIHGSAKLERLWTGARWAEGPAYFPAHGQVIFSDIPNDRLMRFDEADGSTAVFRSPCRFQNGHTVDFQGRLIACEHQGRAVSRIEHDGSRTLLADRFAGKRLNSPNDVVVKRDGTIWFTDPTYGIDSDYEGDAAASDIGACNVYRLDPETGALSAVITDMVRPNGLAFSPDERILYVADTGRTHMPECSPDIRAYDVASDGQNLSNGRVFATCDVGLFDGFRADTNGNIWTSTGNGVNCYASDGTMLGKIKVPELVANLTFGGPKRNRLYITAQTSLYAIYVNARGAAL